MGVGVRGGAARPQRDQTAGAALLKQNTKIRMSKLPSRQPCTSRCTHQGVLYPQLCGESVCLGVQLVCLNNILGGRGVALVHSQHVQVPPSAGAGYRAVQGTGRRGANGREERRGGAVYGQVRRGIADGRIVQLGAVGVC